MCQPLQSTGRQRQMPFLSHTHTNTHTYTKAAVAVHIDSCNIATLSVLHTCVPLKLRDGHLNAISTFSAIYQPKGSWECMCVCVCRRVCLDFLSVHTLFIGVVNVCLIKTNCGLGCYMFVCVLVIVHSH